ncbi:MAG TPA: hypothetical protein VH796_01790 [Nitrososphaeraceae archaeon]|jgi:DNA-binding PadR family transcriptional regulator
MPIFKKWYSRKRPTLQIKILRNIASEGESSKRRLEDDLDANYPDISDAIELLKKKKIIVMSRADMKSRRAEIYYKLTKRGLEAIIDEFADPEVFWKAVISYCELSKDTLSPEEFNKYYKTFEAKYVGYSQARDFFFQYAPVDKLFEEWLSDNRDDDVHITISQKVLECLALHRSASLEQILEHLHMQTPKKKNGLFLDESFFDRLPDSDPLKKRYLKNKVTKENIMSVINRYIIPSNYSFHQFLEISEPKDFSTKYSEIISHLLIRVIDSNTGKRYELTIFGVILILAIVYYKRAAAQSDIHFHELLLENRIEKYYNIVVSNYKDKLPLIFKRWKLLVKVFVNVDNLGQYLEPVFDIDWRKNQISLPVNMGGVKELYENTHTLSLHRYSKLTHIYESGCSALKMIRKDVRIHMSFIEKILSDIELQLVSADLKKFMEYAAKQKENQNIYQTDQTDMVTAIEKSFANEISFLFYIGLARKVKFAYVGDEQIIPSSLHEFISYDEQQEFVKPRESLFKILKRDTEIKDKFMSWLGDSISYGEQVVNNMRILQSEINKQS